MPIPIDPRPLRILIVRVGAMGDVLHAMPAVALLRQWLPDAHIGWAVDPRLAPLLQAHASAVPGSAAMPLVDRIYPVESREWSKHPLAAATGRSILQLRRELRAQQYDLALDLQGSIRSAVIARMCGPRLCIGSDTPCEAPARWLYRQTAAHTRVHVIQQAAEIVQAAIAGSAEEQPALPGTLPKAPLPRDPEAEAWCDATLAGPAAPLVFMAPTAGWGAKRWPVEKFAALARELAGRGCRVLINATPPAPDTVAEQVVTLANSPGSDTTANPVSGRPAARLFPVTSLEMALPQLIALLRRADLVIAGDSGPLHLAAALGRPVVALFGPTDPARNGPFATRSRVLRHPSSVTDHRRHSQTEAGLARISVEEVRTAALDLLRPEERSTLEM